MKYSEIDLQIEDIMWFAIDKQNHVLAFTSGGCGNIPEFVCRSKEETQVLEEYFMKQLKKTTQGTLAIDSDGSPLAKDGLSLAEKGVYVYDVSIDDGHDGEYVQIAIPQTPILVEQLPPEILAIVNCHKISADVTTDKYIHVDNAY